MDLSNVSKIEGENYKRMLEEEAIFRIKTGKFRELFPLVQSLTLSKKMFKIFFFVGLPLVITISFSYMVMD